jgi:hypothetical protein
MNAETPLKASVSATLPTIEMDQPKENFSTTSVNTNTARWANAATTNLCAVLSARDAARGVLVLAAVPTAPSSCVLALNAPDSTSTPRTLVDTALASARSLLAW